MKDHTHSLFVSVDMDEWYLARWATGSANSKWTSTEACCQEVYGQSTMKNLDAPTEKIVSLFEEFDFKSTFFFTGVMAEAYPNLVKKIVSAGHEVACHNYFHIDYKNESEKKFKEDLTRSKKLLEDLSGTEVIGYRSPNSSIPENLIINLLDAGFKYDSSVTPTRKLFGKFGDFTSAPSYPYYPDVNNIGIEGSSDLLEIPWAVFPLGKLPAGSGITHRVAGDWYNSKSIESALKKGSTSYYFHPYEICALDELKKIALPLKAKLFLRNCGRNYYSSLQKFMAGYKNRLINGKDLYEERLNHANYPDCR